MMYEWQQSERDENQMARGIHDESLSDHNELISEKWKKTWILQNTVSLTE